MAPRERSTVKLTAAVLVSALLVAAGALASINGQDDQPAASAPEFQPIKATLDQLEWISGAWAGDALGGYAEEHWTSPRGDAMVGMFRLTGGDNKHDVSEFIMIEQAGEHIVYRFRHFGSGHKPWEDADKPLVFDLVELEKNKAVFHSSVQGDPRRLTYTRNDDALSIHVQGDDEDGALNRGFVVSLKRTRLGGSE